MITISLCMIVRDEEAVLRRCLDSAKDIVDEIILVDTGSTDKTKEIAQQYTNHVYDFEWIDDFSAARNYAFSKATMDYQMWLDADDILPEEEGNKLRTLKQTLDPSVDIVTMLYHTHFNEQGIPVHTSTRERLLKRKQHYRWQDPVHECIPLVGNVQNSGIAIWHKKPPQQERSTRNLHIYRTLEQSGAPLSPRQQYYYARELNDHEKTEEAVQWFEKFLSGGMGWIEDNIAACFALAGCYGRSGNPTLQLKTLYRSFEYDAPRAEICCSIGYWYQKNGALKTALHWFQLAAALPEIETLGFVLQDYRGYIPNIECCVCCYRLGDYSSAAKYNERAAAFRPNCPSVLHNRKLLSSTPVSA